ncbi:Acyl-CoA synthetase (AMP-forming)/AMP-acid ligase II [Collimonas sp. OK607]|uniref:FadD3 family acyl-CoA ligase n=1 Tax=Collimonas sp. OK607 TaxID=1798194 RepID=UPI0008DF3C1B|nr:FadD3 family acyl-CoA ligase [Collimonas sp. OK607]SFA82478.1 Acyl-CoA synthetase (AMP-forming)/AMP-acid ligase II [Collimonas sp. OK607]
MKQKYLVEPDASVSPNSPNALPMTLPQLLRDAAGRYSTQPAIVDGAVTLSYGGLMQAAEEAARALLALGVGEGDRVAIWAPNMLEWIVAACATHCAGAVMVPINTRMKGDEAADILERSEAKVLFCIGDFLGQYYPSLLDAVRPATLQHIVVIGTGQVRAERNEISLRDFQALASRVPVARVQEREAALHENSVADLMFTSGTTGRPKGVVAAHGAMIRAFSEWSKVTGLTAGDRYLIINPFFHTFGYKAGWVAAFIQGATVYPHQVFDADVVLQRIATDRISFLPGPPALFLSMLAHPELKQFDLASLRVACTGAATVPPILITRMREELGFDVVTTAYGLTECGGCATLCDPTDSVETIAGTCGKALPGTEVRCADEQGKTVPTGQPGEVLLRGYHVMQGYFNDEEATRETIDSDGWLHTGDIGVMDERGYLRITDRLKDMFIVGGFNCYPAEVERILAAHPAIAQVAVVGVPDERMGEVGCACVIPRSGMTVSADDLRAWSRERMANYKVPRYVLSVDVFPVNASNKVLKRQLAETAALRVSEAQQPSGAPG